MDMERDHDLQRYYFKLAFGKLWQMLVYAMTYHNTPVNKRLNPYYQQFRQYVLSLAALQDFDMWQDVAHKLPANLLEETLYDCLDSWHELREEGEKASANLQSFTDKTVKVPDWLEEAIHNIDGWTREPTDLDEIVRQDALQSLTLSVKLTNKQARGKLIIYEDSKAEFYAPTGRTYYGEIQRNTNEYKLLEYLAKHVGKLITISNLSKRLKPPRRERKEVDYSRRVPDTVKAIKDKLGLPNIDTLFTANRGYYGLKYPVEFK